MKGWRQVALIAAGAIPAGVLALTAALLVSSDPAARVHVAADRGHARAAATHEHVESDITYAELPPSTKAEVDQVIAAFRDKYPTGADASRDGWIKATKSLYGIGAHYIKVGGLSAASGFELLDPNILLFDGEGPDAKFAGVSYVVAGGAPEGFTGDHDSWHRHESVCLEGGAVISLSEDDSEIWLSESECTARGGRIFRLGGDQMMHLWIGPGYMEGAAIFAHDHPKLYDGYSPKRDV